MLSARMLFSFVNMFCSCVVSSLLRFLPQRIYKRSFLHETLNLPYVHCRSAHVILLYWRNSVESLQLQVGCEQFIWTYEGMKCKWDKLEDGSGVYLSK